jgi:peroxiredoxin
MESTLINGNKTGMEGEPSSAEQWFMDYLTSPAAPPARQSLQAAFELWGSEGDILAVTHALSRLSLNSSDWSVALPGAEAAFAKQRSLPKYAALLQVYERSVTNPVSRAAILKRLALQYLRSRDTSLAVKYLRELVDLDADPKTTTSARRALYEHLDLGIGSLAPAFASHTINGDVIHLPDYQGRVVLLSFWATTCRPCLGELEYLRAVRAEHGDTELAILAVSIDTNVNDLRGCIELERLSWQHIHEPARRVDGLVHRGLISTIYNVSSIPKVIIVNRSGAIAAKAVRGRHLQVVVRDAVKSG